MTCRISENNLVPCRKRNRGLHSGFPSARIRSRKISRSTGFPVVLSVHIYVALGQSGKTRSEQDRTCEIASFPDATCSGHRRCYGSSGCPVVGQEAPSPDDAIKSHSEPNRTS